MKIILVPTDFSKNAGNACKYAIEMAKEMKAKIILMHTFETPVLYSEIPLVTGQFDYATLYNGALNELKKYHKKISSGADGIVWELMLQQGLASARIAEIALEKKVDLIVMGTTGKGALERTLIGSNTSRVIGKAPCLVLAVPPKAKYRGLKKIVYATDLLNDNLDHVNTLSPFAKMFQAEIMFLNVNTKLLSGREEEDLKKIKQKIKSHVSYPKTSGYICDHTNIPRGITYFLKNHKADCLAMYTHHKDGFSRILNPSVTKEVALHASIPLLVIHENDYMDSYTGQDASQEKALN